METEVGQDDGTRLAELLSSVVDPGMGIPMDKKKSRDGKGCGIIFQRRRYDSEWHGLAWSIIRISDPTLE